jgi:hypothetical protein
MEPTRRDIAQAQGARCRLRPFLRQSDVRLFNRHALGEVARLIDVRAPVHRNMVGQKLKRNTQDDGGQKVGTFGNGQRTKGGNFRR